MSVPAPKFRAAPENFVANGFLFTCDILKVFFVVVVPELLKLHSVRWHNLQAFAQSSSPSF